MTKPRLLHLPQTLRLVVLCATACLAAPLYGQLVPNPTPDPAMENLFYGKVNPNRADQAPVLLFCHGLGGTAEKWWVGNNMYRKAYGIGFRTAFVSSRADNAPGTDALELGGQQVSAAIHQTAAHYGVDEIYLVGHSMGGLNIQAAMRDDPTVLPLIKAVFNVSTPNQGTELADWAFANEAIAGPLNLLTDAVGDMRTTEMAAFRASVDPIIASSGIPFYTLSGDTYRGDITTAITGIILKALTPGQKRDTFNDGVVTVGRARLDPILADDLGALPTHHLDVDSGSASLNRIAGRIFGLETEFNEFDRIATDGFRDVDSPSSPGDPGNSWAWSMKWFKGKLYVGTARYQSCVTLLTSDVRTDTNLYGISVALEQCPEAPVLAEQLGAEIWEYTPETDTWRRAFESPNTIPIAFDENGNGTKFTARDIGFRTLEVHVEADGTEALYAGGVTSGSIYEPEPFVDGGFPGPRILRSVDGVTWSPLPAFPGTFMGGLQNLKLDEATKVRSFRSLKSYNGQLFATVADLIGNGVVIASSQPQNGNNAWEQVSGDREELPVWALEEFNGYLYAITGLTREQDASIPGYGVYKTDASGEAPYTWTPVVTDGGGQTDIKHRAVNGLSMHEFNGQLYVGMNRPTELIRINPDDSWDLLVGETRMVDGVEKRPLTGFTNGFGNGFIGHFWRMQSHEGQLYLGLWDWSAGIQDYSNLDGWNQSFHSQYGFDLLRSSDGVNWTFLSRSGMGNPKSWGVRSFASTPAGLFFGTAHQRGGLDIYKKVPAPSTGAPAPPVVDSASVVNTGGNVLLSWDPVPGAVRYHVYRAGTVPLDDLFPEPTGGEPGSTIYPLPFGSVATTTNLFHSENGGSLELPGLYFVRAEGPDGKLSPPSNTVPGPSRRAP